jgi:hypothetical protein
MARAVKQIDELLNAHASDKHSQNGYGSLYHALFRHLRYEPMNVLEIGIGTVTPGAHVSMYGHDLPGYRPGASLRAWSEYFPSSQIYGLDVQTDTLNARDRTARIIVDLCDSTNAVDVAKTMTCFPDFDIVIDDGSHLVPNQLATLKNFYPYVRPGGFYIIEDVNRVDPNQPRLPIDHVKELHNIIGDDLYFVASFPKADIVVISKRGQS